MLDFSRLKSKRNCLTTAIKEQNVTSVSNLLESEFINLNYVDETGNTPLHIAASNGNIDITRLLVKHGASHNIQNRHGFFPIHLASFYGHIELMVFLLDGKNFEHQACILVEDKQSRKRTDRRSFVDFRKQQKQLSTIEIDDERQNLIESEDEER